MAGYQKLTASGVVNTSGRPIRLFGVNLESTTEGDGTVTLYDGTSTSGTKIDVLVGKANDWDRFPFSEGLSIPSGLYIDFGSNVSTVVIRYETLS